MRGDVIAEPFGGPMKARDGFILQAVGPGGERRHFVRQGFGGDQSGRPAATLGDQLTAVCDELDALPGEWRIETISTPATIYRDLQGTRRRLVLSGQIGGRQRSIPANAYEDFRPERAMLGKIGRLDLLA